MENGEAFRGPPMQLKTQIQVVSHEQKHFNKFQRAKTANNNPKLSMSKKAGGYKRTRVIAT